MKLSTTAAFDYKSGSGGMRVRAGFKPCGLRSLAGFAVQKALGREAMPVTLNKWRFDGITKNIFNSSGAILNSEQYLRL